MRNEINWQKKSESCQKQLVDDLKSLIAIPSFRDDEQATNDSPLGPGPKSALLHFGKIAERDGFEFYNLNNIVGYIEYVPKGADDQYVAILGHLDVVPAGDGWETDPYSASQKNGNIYGRGSSDDKGPLLSAYYALKIVVGLGTEFKHRIRLIVGTDEENDWTCVNYYFDHEPAPLFGFSPDAEFPIINGEKGISQFEDRFIGKNEGPARLLSFRAGQRTNMVPGKASAKLIVENADQLKKDFESFLTEYPFLSGQAIVADDQIGLVLSGLQAHGAFPESGHNAGTYLASFLKKVPLALNAKDFIQYLADKAHLDYKGVKIGVSSHDELMGDLSVNPGIMNFAENEDSFINLNIRFPKSTNGKQILSQLNESIKKTDLGEFKSVGFIQEPHYVDQNDPIVKNLLAVYHDQTGFPAHQMIIGGGTYARLMKRGVAYGALFPDSDDTMHKANEHISLNDLKRATSIYAEAIYRLADLD